MKKILVAAAMVFTFFLGACSYSIVDAGQEHPLKIWAHNENGKYETLCVVDESTGVNYIVVGIELHGDPGGAAITPRLNSDGSLYVTE